VDDRLHPKAPAYHAAYLGSLTVGGGGEPSPGDGQRTIASLGAGGGPPTGAASGEPSPGDGRPAIASLQDEALRELATSWGLTQIMGYHMVGRRGTVRDLIEPEFHYGVAVELLEEFAGRFELDLGSEFAAMFRCWNTGSPYGVTFDPNYVENGLRRMESYRELAKGI